jgi:RHS repeat-associated protein
LDADFGFTGHYTDAATSLLFAPYRMYDAALGRWLSRDPIGEEGGINLYGYVGNAPVNWFDPLGLDPLVPNPTADKLVRAKAKELVKEAKASGKECSVEAFRNKANGEVALSGTNQGPSNREGARQAAPSGSEIVANLHTHYNGSTFSNADILSGLTSQTPIYICSGKLGLKLDRFLPESDPEKRKNAIEELTPKAQQNPHGGDWLQMRNSPGKVTR